MSWLDVEVASKTGQTRPHDTRAQATTIGRRLVTRGGGGDVGGDAANATAAAAVAAPSRELEAEAPPDAAMETVPQPMSIVASRGVKPPSDSGRKHATPSALTQFEVLPLINARSRGNRSVSAQDEDDSDFRSRAARPRGRSKNEADAVYLPIDDEGGWSAGDHGLEPPRRRRRRATPLPVPVPPPAGSMDLERAEAALVHPAPRLFKFDQTPRHYCHAIHTRV